VTTLIVLLAIYVLPSVVAASRQVPNVGSVIVIDLLLGWTLIGWVVAMAMAVRTVPQAVLDARTHPAVTSRPQTLTEECQPFRLRDVPKLFGRPGE
jgi:hypothetical protein